MSSFSGIIRFIYQSSPPVSTAAELHPEGGFRFADDRLELVSWDAKDFDPEEFRFGDR